MNKVLYSKLYIFLHFSRFGLFRNLIFSGKITAVEFSDLMEKHGRVMEPDGIRLVIDAFNENDDGQIRKIKKYQN